MSSNTSISDDQTDGSINTEYFTASSHSSTEDCTSIDIDTVICTACNSARLSTVKVRVLSKFVHKRCEPVLYLLAYNIFISNPSSLIVQCWREKD